MFLFLSLDVSGDVPLSPDVRRLARSVIRGQGLPASGGNWSHAEKEGRVYTSRDRESLALGKYEKI